MIAMIACKRNEIITEKINIRAFFISNCDTPSERHHPVPDDLPALKLP